MEEILASIRRIISEDTEAGKPPPAPLAAEPVMPEKPAATAEALELTEMVEEDGSVVNLRSAVAKVKPVAVEPAPIAPPPPPAPAPADPAPGLTMPDDEALISSATAVAATATLTSLRSSSKETETRPPSMPIGSSSLTLEDLVRQELKPILKDWLDQNLNGIVERLVDREVRRLSRQADTD